jgi:hypothetical protein
VKNSLRAIWVVVAVGAGISVGAARPARAELVLALTPGVGLGLTDNVNNDATGAAPPANPQSGFYGTAAFGATLRDERALSTYSLSYGLQYTHFFTGPGADTITNGVGVAGVWHLSARTDLSLAANAGFSRTSAVNNIDVTNPALTQVQVTGANLYATGGVTETLFYQPNARKSFRQTLGATQVQFIDTNLPNATTVGLELRASLLGARDNYFLSFQFGDGYSTHVAPGMEKPFTQGNTFTTQLTAGWRRDYNPFWFSELMAGPSAIFQLDGLAVIAPVATATLGYQRRPWFLTAIAGQTPALNLYLGSVTINDQVTLRLALPLDKADRFFVVGYAAYIYGRVPPQGSGSFVSTLNRAFDTRTAGVTLSAKAKRLPLAGSIQYTISDQVGGAVGNGGGKVPTVERQTLILSVGGVFAFGPGTPPLFAGAQ